MNEAELDKVEDLYRSFWPSGAFAARGTETFRRALDAVFEAGRAAGAGESDRGELGAALFEAFGVTSTTDVAATIRRHAAALKARVGAADAAAATANRRARRFGEAAERALERLRFGPANDAKAILSSIVGYVTPEAGEGAQPEAVAEAHARLLDDFDYLRGDLGIARSGEKAAKARARTWKALARRLLERDREHWRSRRWWADFVADRVDETKWARAELERTRGYLVDAYGFIDAHRRDSDAWAWRIREEVKRLRFELEVASGTALTPGKGPLDVVNAARAALAAEPLAR